MKLRRSSDPIMIAAVVQMTAVEADRKMLLYPECHYTDQPMPGVKHADMLVPGSIVSNGHIVMQGTLHQH